MVLYIIFGIVAIGALGLLGSDNSGNAVNEFCKLECKQNIQKKYDFCC